MNGRQGKCVPVARGRRDFRATQAQADATLRVETGTSLLTYLTRKLNFAPHTVDLLNLKSMKQDHDPRTILFIAGDVSGDIYTGRLAEAVRTRHPDWTLHALGGRHLGSAIESSPGGCWIGDTSD